MIFILCAALLERRIWDISAQSVKKTDTSARHCLEHPAREHKTGEPGVRDRELDESPSRGPPPTLPQLGNARSTPHFSVAPRSPPPPAPLARSQFSLATRAPGTLRPGHRQPRKVSVFFTHAPNSDPQESLPDYLKIFFPIPLKALKIPCAHWQIFCLSLTWARCQTPGSARRHK
jgi:hypothetical protein